MLGAELIDRHGPDVARFDWIRGMALVRVHEAADAGRIADRESQVRGLAVGDGRGHRRHAIDHAVERDVFLQPGIGDRIGFEREHSSRRPGPLREQHRVGADVGAGFEHDVSGSDRATKGVVLVAVPRHVPVLRRHEHDLSARKHRLKAAAPRRQPLREEWLEPLTQRAEPSA